MEDTEPLVTLAGAADLKDLTEFECARRGVWYEEQVENFVRTSLLTGPPLSEHRRYEAFTLRSAGTLVGVMGVRGWAEAPAGGGTQLVVGALSLAVQGTATSTGEPFAAFLMRAMIQAARDAEHGLLICGHRGEREHPQPQHVRPRRAYAPGAA